MSIMNELVTNKKLNRAGLIDSSERPFNIASQNRKLEKNYVQKSASDKLKS